MFFMGIINYLDRLKPISNWVILSSTKEIKESGRQGMDCK